MEQFKIHDLLRYGFSGALFFLALLLTKAIQLDDLAKFQGLTQATMATGLVLLAGTLIYTIYRASFFPILLYPLALLILSVFRAYPFEWSFIIPFKESHAELEVDEWRFSLLRDKSPLAPHFAEWAAQIHFLYCSSIAVSFALWLGPLWSKCQAPMARHLLFGAAAAFALTGFVHHVRCLLRLKTVRQQEWELDNHRRTQEEGQRRENQVD